MNKDAIGHGYVPQSAYTTTQFADAHHIGRTHLYALIKAGKGPRLMKLGRRTLISVEAAADWRRQMEAATLAAAA